MLDEKDLIEKLRRIERLFAGATTDGERVAAGNAMERIRKRLEETILSDPPIEYKFTMRDQWSRRLFVALLRRYGLKPFRYYRQRYTTVMVNVPESFVDETLWPEFKELNQSLRSFLGDVTDRVIKESIFEDSSEPDVVNQEEKLISSGVGYS